MVVLHLVNDFGDSSISTIVRWLVRYFGGEGHTLHVGALNGSGGAREPLERLGARTVDFSSGADGWWACSKRIRDYVRTHGVMVVHSHTPKTLIIAVAALGRVVDRPQHIATKHILNSPGDRRWGLFYSFMDRVLLYFPDQLVAVSDKVYRQIMACPAMGTAPVCMIRNAIDQETCHAPDQRDSCRAEFGLAREIVVIGSSGRLEKVKRYDLMLRAFAVVRADFPATRLMIAGDGSLRSELEKLADDLRVAESVIWTGFRKDVPRLLAAMDIYLQTSVNEGLSLSILEAMAAGKPVVISDVGGARELVENGRTGLLIPAGSATAIERALKELLEDPEKRVSLASAGREYVSREFSIGQMMESYRRAYETMLQRGKFVAA